MSRKKSQISELDLSKIGGRIAFVRLRNNENQAQFAEKTGLSKGNVSGLENHKYEPSFSAIVKILEIYKVDSTWLLTGIGDMLKGSEPCVVPRHQAWNQTGPLHMPPRIIVRTKSEAAKEHLDVHFQAIPLYESGRLSAWSGGYQFDDHEVVEDHVLVYIPELGNRSCHHLIAARVGGDSMQPLIPEKSIVVIDLTDRVFVDRRIYVCRWDEGGVVQAAIKRVCKSDRQPVFVLWSENVEYPPIVTDTEWDTLCIGRVIWMWREISNA